MSSIRRLLKPTGLVAALALTAAAVMIAPAKVESVAWGNDTQWLITAYSRTHNNLCTNQDPNRICREQCYLDSNGQTVATGTLCCMLSNETECSPGNLFTGN